MKCEDCKQEVNGLELPVCGSCFADRCHERGLSHAEYLQAVVDFTGHSPEAIRDAARLADIAPPAYRADMDRRARLRRSRWN